VAQVNKRDGLINLSVSASAPERAVEMANAYIEELRRLNSTLAVTEAQQRRMFFEIQLQQTRDRLTSAQLALQASGITPGALKAEPKAAAESYARLRAEVTGAELRLQALKSNLTEEAPEVRTQRLVLSGLRSQLASSEAQSKPVEGADYISRFREYKYQETLFELYARQFELARSDESREGNLIQVLDNPTLPDKASKPRRLIIAFTAALFGWLAAMLWVLWRIIHRVSEPEIQSRP
jgi:capsule polysaccharide export protein KpsE/RkpR